MPAPTVSLGGEGRGMACACFHPPTHTPSSMHHSNPWLVSTPQVTPMEQPQHTCTSHVLHWNVKCMPHVGMAAHSRWYPHFATPCARVSSEALGGPTPVHCSMAGCHAWAWRPHQRIALRLRSAGAQPRCENGLEHTQRRLPCAGAIACDNASAPGAQPLLIRPSGPLFRTCATRSHFVQDRDHLGR
jgi:hypothetical protein